MAIGLSLSGVISVTIKLWGGGDINTSGGTGVGNCGKRVCKDTGTIDHIVPRALGGVTSWTNCILACNLCNSQKADRKLEQAVRTDKHKNWRGPSPMRLMLVPKKPKFSLLKYDKDLTPSSW